MTMLRQQIGSLTCRVGECNLFTVVVITRAIHCFLEQIFAEIKSVVWKHGRPWKKKINRDEVEF